MILLPLGTFSNYIDLLPHLYLFVGLLANNLDYYKSRPENQLRNTVPTLQKCICSLCNKKGD